MDDVEGENMEAIVLRRVTKVSLSSKVRTVSCELLGGGRGEVRE